MKRAKKTTKRERKAASDATREMSPQEYRGWFLGEQVENVGTLITLANERGLSSTEYIIVALDPTTDPVAARYAEREGLPPDLWYTGVEPRADVLREFGGNLGRGVLKVLSEGPFHEHYWYVLAIAAEGSLLRAASRKVAA